MLIDGSGHRNRHWCSHVEFRVMERRGEDPERLAATVVRVE
jgi:hypothetical protein